MFAIAKDTYCGNAKLFVTAIKDGGRAIDNARVENGKDPWQARKFKTRSAADKAQADMSARGGYDDYRVVCL